MKARKNASAKFNRPHRCSVCGKTGHRKGTKCPQFKGKAAKKQMSKLDKDTSYSYPGKLPQVRLRDVKQKKYETIVGMTELQAKAELKAMGLLPPMSNRTCFKCGSDMARQSYRGPSALRCTNRSCQCDIRRGDLAYTPLWHMNKGGHLSYKTYLKALYVFSLRVPLDAAVHLIGHERDSIEQWFRYFRIATAHTELFEGRQMSFGPGVVEAKCKPQEACLTIRFRLCRQQ